MKAIKCLTIIFYKPHINEGWFWKDEFGAIGFPCIGVTIQWCYR